MDRRIAHPGAVAIAVPNRLWAANQLNACRSCGVKAGLCIAQDIQLPDLPQEIAESELQGLSLIRHLGWDKRDELAYALLQGNEEPDELLELVRSQLAHPTIPDLTAHIPIMLVDELRGPVDYLFVVGCVSGFMPRALHENHDRSAFTSAIRAGRVRTTVSYFVEAPADLVEAARIDVARYKMKGGGRLGMTMPSPFLGEAGIWRPSTTGGQALLRTYGLN